ncbi:MAG: PKD domain-containing protein [Thermoplasmata archaeon]|nr:PKD domain-containing protein [Thermoplasmata archaeon]
MLACVPPTTGQFSAAPCPFTVSLNALPTTGNSPLLVRFNATVSSGSPSNFAWDFGDGSYWNTTSIGAATPLHRYATPGTFQASVAVTEGTCTSSAADALIVSPALIQVVLSAAPESGVAPLTVRFNATATGGTGTYVNVLWRFGDGGAGSGTGLVYTYERSGTFEAGVVVTDSDGHSGMANVSIAVTGSDGVSGGGPELLLGLATGIAAIVGLTFVVLYRRRPGPRRPTTVLPTDRGSPPPGALLGVDPAPDSPAGHAPGGALRTSRSRLAEEPPTREHDAAPPTQASGAAGSARSRERRQLSQRVLLHIGSQGYLGRDEVAPVGLTQSGMAHSLGVSQNSLTNVLRRLVAAGVLEQDVRHVRGQPRRLRVYHLTGRGDSLYQDVRKRAPGLALGEARPKNLDPPPTPEKGDPGAPGT